MQENQVPEIPMLDLKKKGLYVRKYHKAHDKERIQRLDTLIKSVRRQETKRKFEVHRMNTLRSQAINKHNSIKWTASDYNTFEQD